MRVAVIGAGVVGVLTAHYLRKRQCEVTVFESLGHPAGATSKANGGQLSYSFCDAMADPTLLAKLPGVLLNRDPAFKIKFALDLQFMSWGLQFLRNCTTQRRDANTRQLLRLAETSANLMQDLHRQFGATYHQQRNGKLVLLDEVVSREIQRRVQLKQHLGFDVRLLTPAEIVDLEPSIEAWGWQPKSAIYAPNDEVGDARCFVATLAQTLSANGVTFRYGHHVNNVSSVGGQGVTLETADDRQRYDAVVLCNGDAANQLLASHKQRLPIMPMAGYSVSLPMTSASPKANITALEHRIVFSPLNQQVRIAGFADVNNAEALEARTEQLIDTAQKLAPSAAQYDAADVHPWRGYRGMTPDSQPIVGPAKLDRVYLNVGHGMFGWTLGASTSDMIAALVTQR